MRAWSLVAVCILLAGCAGPELRADVEILDRTYAPEHVEVGGGQALVFRNVDDEEHTVTLVAANATEDILDEHRVVAGASATLRIEGFGDFIVYCRYHGDAASGQRMTIQVG